MAATTLSEHRLLHVVPVGPDVGPVMVGVRHFPVAGVALLFDSETEANANEFEAALKVLGVPITRHHIGDQSTMGIMSTINRLVQETELMNYDELLVNVGAASTLHACGAISASFVNGVRAIHVADGKPMALPVLRFSYRELISDAKLRILKALNRTDGGVDSLSELAEMTGIDKSLLSYHLRGGRDGQGLEEMGLVEIDRRSQGRLNIQLTSMGHVLLIGREDDLD